MIYLDNAATSYPKPQKVLDRIFEYQKNSCGNPARSSHRLAREATRVVMETRLKVQKFFKSDDPMRVIFTKNCSEALNLALLGYIKENDHVITSVMEHNSIVRVLEHLKKSRNIDVTYLKPSENGSINPQEMEKYIKNNTSLIIINHANNLTGNINDIEEIGKIAHKNRIRFLVDAAQTAGKLHIDMERMNIDLLASPGHKSLFSMQGVGFLIMKKDMIISPLMYGGTGSFSDRTGDIKEIPDMYEIGTLNSPAIAGLSAGIDFINEIGIENISSYEDSLIGYLYEKLEKNKNVKIYTKKSNRYSGILSFNVKNHDSSYVADFLDKNEVMVRSGLHCNPLGHRYHNTIDSGQVRVSISYFNTLEDIEKLVELISKID